MNVDAINRTIALIKKSPAERVCMSHYFRNFRTAINIDDFDDDTVTCGTAGCLAGWGIVANKEAAAHIVEHSDRCQNGGRYSVAALAVELFGLDQTWGDHLFQMWMSTAELNELRDLALSFNDVTRVDIEPFSIFDTLPADIRKQAAIDVLEHFVESGSVHWLACVVDAAADYRAKLANQ